MCHGSHFDQHSLFSLLYCELNSIADGVLLFIMSKQTCRILGEWNKFARYSPCGFACAAAFFGKVGFMSTSATEVEFLAYLPERCLYVIIG